MYFCPKCSYSFDIVKSSQDSSGGKDSRTALAKMQDAFKKFDEGVEDIIEDLDLSQVKRPGYEQKLVNVDFSVWMIDALDREANRLGITRQSLIKVWISEGLDRSTVGKT
jgi:hypothetical protein